MNPELRGLG